LEYQKADDLFRAVIGGEHLGFIREWLGAWPADFARKQRATIFVEANGLIDGEMG